MEVRFTQLGVIAVVYAVYSDAFQLWWDVLWPSYVIGQAIYIFIVWFLLLYYALWNRADHYIFATWFFSSFFFLLSSFFPRLISAVAD